MLLTSSGSITTTVPDYCEIKATDNRNNAPAFKTKCGAV